MKQYITIFNYLIILTSLLEFASCNFAPGSYPYAETYEFNVEESVLLDAIKHFKIENAEYNVPEHIQLQDGRSKQEADYWYHLYFYYPNENKIVYAWTRPTNGKTSFALISINEGLTLGNWKDINKDLRGRENKEAKKEFEERILNPIKKYLQE